MTRSGILPREFAIRLGCAALLLSAAAPLAPAQAVLPGTRPFTFEGDPATGMVDAINAFLAKETAAATDRGSQSANAEVALRRETFRRLIGAVDPRVPFSALQFTSTTASPAEVARANGYRVYAVRWPVFDDVDTEGLLLEPEGKPRARIVAIPDADWSPEMLTGLARGVEPSAQFARRLAENGCQVLVPVLIDRSDTWSGIPGVRMTNQSHREWIYRMAYESGRHIIGYEVQKVLAAIDWFEHENAAFRAPIGIAGYGEGGLLALYAASLDTRIHAALVSGYFQPRQDVWREPIYRDVWGLLREFGDADLARMIAPRALIVEASRFPEVAGPPASTSDRRGAAPIGTITTPPLEAVRGEVNRASAAGNIQLVVSGEGRGSPGSEGALTALLRSLKVSVAERSAGDPPADLRANFDPSIRLHRQFDQLVAHTQAVIRRSGGNRTAFWARADASSPESWKRTTQPMRDYIWKEVIGKLPDPSVPADPRTRLIFDEPKYRGYEVMLNVWPGVFAYGILLVPKNIQPGEKRPVVVCQHGLEGRVRDVADPAIDSHYYHRFAVRLAEEGFVTFAPQNPYIGEDRFRMIQRKGHPLKLSLFSFILGQHQRMLEWLGGLPFVDPGRIGFYGLSYGGKTAVRVPPLLDGYALSICSADFNEWVWKTTSLDSPYSYMVTNEYDMLEFNFANVVNYSDLANLMAPRPFMVERGHEDGVAPDEWVAYEYAKVRRFYARMGIADRTGIEFFNGPHTIHGVGTFAFLRNQLHWPQLPGGAFATNTYRNLFLETGHTPEEISHKIDAAFQQLFHGDPESQTVYYPAGQNANGPLAYLTDINNRDVRSEGMSYGMMIAVQLNRKAEFDALWNWSKTYMYQSSPTHPSYGYFSWSMKVDGTPNSESPAPDGEEYWAMALYFAAGRWPGGKGIYDYRAEADRLLDNMKNRKIIDGQTSRGPETGGPEFHPEYKMVRFTPNLRRPDHTDPSYHLPAFYELWARWGPAADRPFWADAAKASRDYLQKVTNPVTALAPNYANYDGTPVAGQNADFGPDAWRTAANWAVDWSWWAADPRERNLSDRIQAFFESQGMENYGNRFALDGKPLGGSHSPALVATNAVASLASTNRERAAKFVEALWKTEIPSGRYRYYDGMWYMMGLLHCAGEFRIWPPK